LDIATGGLRIGGFGKFYISMARPSGRFKLNRDAGIRGIASFGSAFFFFR
jgi:hypothetical protein